MTEDFLTSVLTSLPSIFCSSESLPIYLAALWGGVAIAIGLLLVGVGLRQLNQELEARIEQRTLALHQSEEHYRQLSEDMPALICKFLPDSTLTYVNSTYCQYFNQSSDELLGQRFLNFLPDTAAQQTAKSHYLSLTPESPSAVSENRVMRPDGQERWLQWIDQAFFDPQGHITSIQSIGFDITERKQAEEMLHKSQMNLVQIVNTLPGCVFVKDIDGRFLLVNQAVADTLNHSIEELTGKLHSEIHPDTAQLQQMLAADRQVIESGQPLIIPEEPYTQADGTTLFFQTCKIPIEFVGHPKPAILGISVDITELKQTEQALRQANATNRALLNAIPDLILRISRDGICRDGIPTQAFPMLSSIESQIGKSLWEILPSNLAQRRLDMIERTFQTEQPQVEEYQICINGEERHEEAHCVLFGQDEVMILVRDITDHKRAEIALKESEHRYVQILDSVQDMVFCKDINSVIRYANRATCQYYGMTADQLRDITDVPFNDREHTQQYLKDDRRVFTAGQPVDILDEPNRRADGEVRYFHTVKSPIFDTEGQVVQLVGVSRDITERKQMEEALQVRVQQQAAVAQLGLLALESADLSELMETATVLIAERLKVEYCKVLELLPDGESMLLRSGVGWQPGLVGQAMVGIGADSQAGYTLSVDEPVIVEMLQTDPRFNGPQLLQKHQVVSGLSVIIKGSDRPFGVLGAHTTHQRHFSQDDVNFLQSVANILATAIRRHLSEEELRESEERFRQLAENIQEVFWMADAEMTQLLYISPAYEILWGRTKISAHEYPASFIEAIYPEDRDRVVEVIQQQRYQGWEQEYRITQPGGTLRWIWEQAFPVSNAEGNIHRIVGICRDITERKQAEFEIHKLNQVLEEQNHNLEALVEQRTAALSQRTAQLEASNRELESFSYSVSHDLRAPLRHINGFVNALRQQLQSHEVMTNPKIGHYLQVIENSSQKMAQLIDGLLTLSRLGRKPMEVKPVDLQSMIDEAIVLAQSTFESITQVEFVIDPLPTVSGDATLLQQVLINLIGNAIKFSRNHPAPCVEIGSLEGSTIFVRDNGVGFSMDYADQLFGAFQRLHDPTEFEGTGIGLAIAQRIIHRHSGQIWAESQPDQGATFYFTVGQVKVVSQYSVENPKLLTDSAILNRHSSA